LRSRKLPAKIKTFLCLVMWARNLSKDSLRKKGWDEETHCMLCALDESTDHLFFQCPIPSLVWGAFLCAYDVP
jgi:hypothetical protein